jgi:hypothetical protein
MEVMADLTSCDLSPVPDVLMEPQYRYIVIDANANAGDDIPVGSSVRLIVDFDATTLTFPVPTFPGIGGPVAIGPTCSGGKYTVPEQKWSGTNVASIEVTEVTSEPPGLDVTKNPPDVTRAATTAGIGTFGGTVASFVVECSNTQTVRFELTLTATGLPHTTGTTADEEPKVQTLTINPQPVNQG